MNIHPGSRLRIGPHVIEVRTILECYRLTDAMCVDVLDADYYPWTIFLFHDCRTSGKGTRFGVEFLPVEEITQKVTP